MLTIKVIGTARKSANFFKSGVGIGSRREDLEGKALISETISDTETLSNEENGITFTGASAAGWQLRAASRADRMSVTFLHK